MKKWIALLVAVAIALAAYVAAGPYFTVRAIDRAVRTQDAGALERQVDFVALRSSFKAQLADRIARRAGDGAGNTLFGGFGMVIASTLAGGAVDVMVTPAGLAAIMEGRKVWDRASGVPMRSSADGDAAERARPRPFANANYRYESTSRFTATVVDDQARPVMFVLTRDGLSWRLSDIRLPP